VMKFDEAYEVMIHDPPPGRTFSFECKINVRHPIMVEVERSGQKPPSHFHPHSWEYMKVTSGRLTIEIEGVPKDYAAEDGEVCVPPGVHHCLYTKSEQPTKCVEFWLSARAAEEMPSRLDQVFFENWYGYQEDILLRGVKPDFIQVLSMFDGGDSYLTLPAWVPFRKALARGLGIVVGRWIGGLLGYQPFYPEWTSDWGEACRKMESHWSQRHFARLDKQEMAKKSFPLNH